VLWASASGGSEFVDLQHILDRVLLTKVVWVRWDRRRSVLSFGLDRHLQLAYLALDRQHAGTVEDTLERWVPSPSQPDYRNWEWYYLLSASQASLESTLYDHIQAVRQVDWSNDDQRFVSLGDDGVVRIWDVTTGKEVASLPKTEANPAA
jgi:WD40 repeat protein